MKVIKVKNITKSYNGNVVLGPINLEIESGSSIAIFGANGAGKTTLCEIISNTKNQSLGEVEYNFNKKDIPYVMGINFQDQVYPNFITVKELINFYHKIYLDKIKTEIFNIMLDKFQLKELYKRKVNSLSGGQRQRVNLFLSLFHQPKIYIGDEISTGLDVKTRIDIINFLQEQISLNNITLILVSHNLDEIQALCKRIIFLKNGQIIDDTTVVEVTKKYGSLLKYYLEKTETTPEITARKEKK